VIIVLFVSIIVGVTIVQFAKNIITESKVKLADLGKKEMPKERVIELGAGSNDQIVYLSEECLKSSRNREVERKACFAVQFGTGFSFVGAAIGDVWQNNGNNAGDLKILRLDGTTSAIFIYYNPAGYVEIS
jgi:hypothetical protein